MDILSTVRSVMRFKWITIPVIVLTGIATVYVGFFAPRLYESTSTYLLLNPEPSKAATANPFLQLPDQAAIVGVLSELVMSPQIAEKLVAQGVSPDYEVGASQTYGQGSRIIEVYSPGPTPEAAVNGAVIIGDELRAELDAIQKAEAVPPNGRITLLALNPEPTAKPKISSVLRSMVGVIALGIVLLFFVVSVAQAWDEVRAKRKEPGRDAGKGSGPPTTVVDDEESSTTIS